MRRRAPGPAVARARPARAIPDPAVDVPRRAAARHPPRTVRGGAVPERSGAVPADHLLLVRQLSSALHQEARRAGELIGRDRIRDGDKAIAGLVIQPHKVVVVTLLAREEDIE